MKYAPVFMSKYFERYAKISLTFTKRRFFLIACGDTFQGN